MAPEVAYRSVAEPGALVVAGHLATTEDPASAGLALAIAALRRDLNAYAADARASDLTEVDHPRELAAALAGLEGAYAMTGDGLAGVVATNAERSGGHLQRVCRYAMMLTAVVAPEHATDRQFEYGFLLHDIGKLMVPDGEPANPGALTVGEWELIKEHPERGRSLLEGIPFLSDACEIVHAHHERWDGKGYPRGLAGNEIPVGARILALCDAFDAMTQDRPYRKAASIVDARGEIHRGGRGQFWPAAVDAFLALPVADLEDVRRPGMQGTKTVEPPTPRPGPSSTANAGGPQGPVPRPLGRLARALAKRRGPSPTK